MWLLPVAVAVAVALLAVAVVAAVARAVCCPSSASRSQLVLLTPWLLVVAARPDRRAMAALARIRQLISRQH